jgi:antitoxin (DNA-binding transcriptional repressor) of toxin-antitoxin stability system
MSVATISYTKNNLSAILEKVKAGETVVILDRDKPIAQITKVDESDDERCERLIAQGKMRPPKRKLKSGEKLVLPDPIPLKGESVDVVSYIREERDAGW